jgi:hypothetical protein
MTSRNERSEAWTATIAPVRDIPVADRAKSADKALREQMEQKYPRSVDRRGNNPTRTSSPTK